MSDETCKKCGSDAVTPFDNPAWKGMCEPCYRRTMDDLTCRKCGGQLPQGRPTGSICPICKDLLMTETLRSQLVIERDETADLVKIRKSGCGATMVMPYTEFTRRERFQSSDFMRQLHTDLTELDEAQERERAAGCVAVSPWPRCAVHSIEGRMWLLTLAAKEGLRIPDRWTCSCQW